MSKELLVNVLTKELGIGVGVASDIAHACTSAQLEAVTEYLAQVKRSSYRHTIDNFDKYALMMTTAFKASVLVENKNPVEREAPQSKPSLRAPREPKRLSKEKLWEFLNA